MDPRTWRGPVRHIVFAAQFRARAPRCALETGREARAKHKGSVDRKCLCGIIALLGAPQVSCVRRLLFNNVNNR